MTPGHFAVVIDEASALRPLRRQFQEWLLTHAVVSAERLDDLCVALTEIATNGLEASGGGSVDVSCRVDGLSLTIRVVNPNPFGNGVHLRTTAQPPDEPRGRGLYLVQQLVDEVDVNQLDGTVDITVRVRL